MNVRPYFLSVMVALQLSFFAVREGQAQSPNLGLKDVRSIALFNGHSLEGWNGDLEKTWRVEDGTIAAGSHDNPAPRNEFLTTTATFRNFDLRLKFKITGNHRVNAGVQFRTRRIPDHHEVSGFQADIGPEWDGFLYDESRRRKTLARPDNTVMKQAREAIGADGWNTYRIRADGPRIQLWFNGVQTVDYTESDPSIAEEGIIGLQIHGGMRAIIQYKDIQISKLPD